MKTTSQIKNQMHRIEKMMYKDRFFTYPKNRQRLKKFHALCDRIDRNLLRYFGVAHLWEVENYKRIDNEFIPASIYAKLTIN